jgi:hypothetical protein
MLVPTSHLQGRMSHYKSLPVGNRGVRHMFSLQTHPVDMRPLGMVFDGSTSLFGTQSALCNFIGHAIWLGQFTPVRHDHVHFVQALLQAFFSLGICCAFTGLYPAYISGVLDKYCLEDDFCLCHLYIAKSTSIILVPLLK